VSGERADLFGQLRSASVSAVVEILAGIHRLRTFSDELNRAGGASGPLSSRDLTYDLTKLQLSFVEAVLRFGNEHADRIFQHLRGADNAPASDQTKLLIEAHPLTARSRKPNRVTASFQIENQSGHSGRLSFACTPLRSAQGKRTRPRISFRAVPAQLEPGTRAMVTLSLTVSRQLTVGRYTAEIDVRVGQRKSGRVDLELKVSR
jgi:hypothetical protein